MSCNSTNPCSNPCPTDCGCTVQVPGTCVFYQGTNLDCIDATKGDTYDSILQSINDIICDLQPPTGQTYTAGTGILITGNVISIDPTITTRITNTENNITALQNCVTQTVKNITSTSLSVTLAGQNSCGRTLNIEYTPPAIPLSQKQGIIHNITEDVTINLSQTYSYDLSPYGLKAGDLVKIKGNILRDNTVLDTNCSKQTIKFTDNSTTITYEFPAGAGVCTYLNYIIFDFEFWLTVHSVAGNNIAFKIYSSSGRFTPNFPSLIGVNDLFVMVNTPTISQSSASEYGSTTFNQTTFKVLFEQTDTSILRQYIVEIIRKIN